MVIIDPHLINKAILLSEIFIRPLISTSVKSGSMVNTKILLKLVELTFNLTFPKSPNQPPRSKKNHVLVYCSGSVSNQHLFLVECSDKRQQHSTHVLYSYLLYNCVMCLFLLYPLPLIFIITLFWFSPSQSSSHSRTVIRKPLVVSWQFTIKSATLHLKSEQLSYPPAVELLYLASYHDRSHKGGFCQ